MHAKKEDGTDYEPDTLVSFHRGIQRHLKEFGYQECIVSSPLFVKSKTVLATRRKELKAKGKGNRPNKSSPLTENEEEKLWAWGQMGDHGPKPLQFTLQFLLTKCFGFRGCHESRQLCFGDITIECDDEGDAFLQFNERLSKTRQGNATHLRVFDPKIFANKINPERCPVRLYRSFVSHRPSAMNNPESPFFLGINYKRVPHSNVWYKCQPMGPATLEKTVRDMCKVFEITGRKLTTVFAT